MNRRYSCLILAQTPFHSLDKQIDGVDAKGCWTDCCTVQDLRRHNEGSSARPPAAIFACQVKTLGGNNTDTSLAILLVNLFNLDNKQLLNFWLPLSFFTINCVNQRMRLEGFKHCIFYFGSLCIQKK